MTPAEIAAAALAEVGYKFTPDSPSCGGTTDELLAIPPDMLLRAANIGRASKGVGPMDMDGVLKSFRSRTIRAQYAERWGLAR